MDEAGGETRTAGVVVEGDDADGVPAALSGAGVRPVEGDVESVLAADPDLVVAVGEDALARIARREPPVPILPVEAGRGVRSVPREALGDAAGHLAAGDWHVEAHPLLGLAWDGRETSTLFDAMLVTAGPADISEFAVQAGGEPVARFRADGVAVATPAGSPGYNRSAGGPVATPGLEVLVVVPVAPFATSLDHWVVPPDAAITVERDEAAVEVLADDRSVGRAPVGDPVRLGAAGQVGLVWVPEGVSPFGPGAGELEKL
jgi:NAD+ kinase